MLGKKKKPEGTETAVTEGSWGHSFRPEAVVVTNTCDRPLLVENMHHIPQFANTSLNIIS